MNEQKTPVDQPVISKPTISTSSNSGRGSSAGIIILIVVLAIVVLGVGGYFGWKYLGKKILNKITGITATSNSGKISVQTIEDALMYPGARITDQKQGGKESVYKAELTLSSSDSVDTIKAYYQNLANQKKWTIARQGSDSDNNYYMTVETKDFTAEINITKYEGYDTTDIDIKISGDNLVVGGIAVTPTATVSAKSTSGSTSGQASSDSYVISDSSTRIISKSELTGFTPWQLKVARNEIYARHGREFVHKDLQCYFQSKDWYKINPDFSESQLDSVENKNVAIILAYENEIGSTYVGNDTGCNTNP